MVGLFRLKIYSCKVMAKKLYVGGLPYSTTESELKDIFSQSGTVESAIIITDKISHRSKGFGFVEMSTDEEAKKAIENLNGKEVNGRKITVAEARPLKPRNNSSYNRFRSNK